MSYSVHYQYMRKKNRRVYTAIRPILIVLSFFLFLLLVFTLWPEGKSAVEDVLSFLRSTVTVSAMNKMAENVQDGMNLLDAMETVFCNLI